MTRIVHKAPMCSRPILVDGMQTTCTNDVWRRAPRLFAPPPDFIDCYDHLPAVKAECTFCGSKRKIRREFLEFGFMREDDFARKAALDG